MGVFRNFRAVITLCVLHRGEELEGQHCSGELSDFLCLWPAEIGKQKFGEGEAPQQMREGPNRK